MRKQIDYKRFCKYVNQQGAKNLHMATACWEWIGGNDKAGRPRFWFNHTNQLARRALFEIDGKKLSTDEHPIALCLDKTCVNPEHLVIGDYDEAQALAPNGPNSRFYPSDVFMIRQMVLNDGIMLKNTADFFSLSERLIEQLVYIDSDPSKGPLLYQ